MFIFYDLIFLLISIIYLPIYLCRRKFHAGFKSRLGVLPENLALNNPIWIHAVSVGEAMAVRGLTDELRKIYPDKKFVISTVTATGNKIAKGIAKGGDYVTYLPLDFSFIIGSVINKISPSLLIIAETEIWPNLIRCLYRKKIPVVSVNCRISDSSFRGYSCIKFLVKPILAKVNLFCAQTERDKERLMRLGASADKIQVTGNMKFDLKDFDFKRNYTEYKSKLGLSPKEKLLIAASTHPGEERIILATYKKLLKDYPDLKLLVAPRHPERAPEIADLIKEFGFEPIRISLLNSELKTHNSKTVFILDTIGELISFYAVADLVFVGGSLVRKGGHNILEPASMEKPVLFGPHMFNFSDIAEMFLSHKAAIMVRNQEELASNISLLLNNPDTSVALGRAAKQLIQQNQGATSRIARLISSCGRYRKA